MSFFNRTLSIYANPRLGAHSPVIYYEMVQLSVQKQLSMPGFWMVTGKDFQKLPCQCQWKSSSPDRSGVLQTWSSIAASRWHLKHWRSENIT